MNLKLPIDKLKNLQRKFGWSVPDGSCGDWKISTVNLTPKAADVNFHTGNRRHTIPGPYKILRFGGYIIMSTSLFEIDDLYDFYQRAEGDVLITGLGIGLLTNMLLSKPEISSLTVIEKQSEVIKLVGPTFKKEKRLLIMHEDAFEFNPENQKKTGWDFIWHDIWSFALLQNLQEMKILHKKFEPFCKFQDSWQRTKLLERSKLLKGE